MKRSRQGKKSQTKSQKTKSRTKSVNSRRSGQASRTHSTWGFAWIAERHARPRAGRSITRAVANVGRPTPTFATGVAPAATGCPCRTTGPCWSGRERSAASARRRASRSASIIVTPPARCAACCVATAISASAITRTIPFLPGPRRPIWRRRGATTGISRAPPAMGSIRSHDLVFSRSRRRMRAKARKPQYSGCFRGFGTSNSPHWGRRGEISRESAGKFRAGHMSPSSLPPELQLNSTPWAEALISGQAVVGTTGHPQEAPGTDEQPQAIPVCR